MSNYFIPQIQDKLLWVRFRALGDVLQALAEIYLIKQKFPTLHICFLTKPEYAEIVWSQPYVEEVICGDKTPISVMKQTAQLIKSNNYDWIGYTYKGMHMPIMAYLSGIKNRIGNSKYLSFLETTNVHTWANQHGIDLHSRPVKTCFPTTCASAYAKQLLLPVADKKKIFCVIGASNPGKLWPTQYWIEFLKPLIQQGWAAIINGYGEKEEMIAEQIKCALNSSNILSVVSKADYVQMVGVASECQVAVGNDTGPLHMAALCGIPTVGIFDYIQPVDVGYNMPWLIFAVAREEKLQTFYAKKRDASVLAELKPEKVREKFDELVEKFSL